jgi:hypothetical protein
MDKIKKPPPQRPGLLTRGAGCKVLGEHTHSIHFSNVTKKNNSIDIHANKGWLVIARAILCWRFDFGQYMPAGRFCQDVQLAGVQNKIAMSRLFSIP